MPEPHKNKSRAPIFPLDVPTLALTSLGLGFLRPAPGTWGSLPPAAFGAAAVLFGVDTLIAQGALFLVILVSSIACVAFGKYAEARFGRKDAAEVVVDETAGCCFPMIVAVWVQGTVAIELASVAAAFLLFRIFDILKPWPARRLEALPTGWGVVADDLAAGIYAALTLALALWALGF